METLLRTILILVAAFAAGHVLPADGTLLPLLVCCFVIAAIIDCGLYLWTGRGIFSHLKNSE